MPRPKLTEQEKAQRKRDRWTKLKNSYKTYEGERGSPEQWQAAFGFRLGRVKSHEILKKAGKVSKEFEILGLTDPKASLEDIKKAYRKRVRETHPDLGGNQDDFELVQAAYESLTGE